MNKVLDPFIERLVHDEKGDSDKILNLWSDLLQSTLKTAGRHRNGPSRSRRWSPSEWETCRSVSQVEHFPRVVQFSSWCELTTVIRTSTIKEMQACAFRNSSCLVLHRIFFFAADSSKKKPNKDEKATDDFHYEKFKRQVRRY